MERVLGGGGGAEVCRKGGDEEGDEGGESVRGMRGVCWRWGGGEEG